MKMRFRLLLGFALIILIALGAVSFFVRENTQQQVEDYWSRGALVGAEDLVLELEAYYAQRETWTGADNLFSSSGKGQGSGQGRGIRSRFRLADAQGIILYDPNEQTIGQQIMPTQLENGISLLIKDKVVGYLLPLDGEYFPGQGLETELLERVDKAILTAALVSGMLALLLALALAYSILHPVQSLTQAASQMADGDLSVRTDVKGTGELVNLGKTFNSMANSLERSRLERRAMTADIAHELRTPLAVQRANLEAMQDGVYELDQKNIAKILDQNQLLTRLVSDLRTLSLTDTGELKLDISQTNLNLLLQRMADRLRPQAAQKQVRINLKMPTQPLSIPIDSQRIEQIIHNLTQNALRHTPENSQIEIKLLEQGNSTEILIHDQGEGIPPETLEHIFERFYRADQARSRDKGGSGLGLAIARRLAEAHAGTLKAKNHPEGGAIFRLMLPK